MSAYLEALRTKQPLPPVATEHDDEHGCCLVELGSAQVLANYSVDEFGDVCIESVSVAGHPVPPEFFSADALKVWADEIKADREHDARISRDAAADAAWLAKQQ